MHIKIIGTGLIKSLDKVEGRIQYGYAATTSAKNFSLAKYGANFEFLAKMQKIQNWFCGVIYTLSNSHKLFIFLKMVTILNFWQKG